eukprot:5851770-Amphidinium_carterae.1
MLNMIAVMFNMFNPSGVLDHLTPSHHAPVSYVPTSMPTNAVLSRSQVQQEHTPSPRHVNVNVAIYIKIWAGKT